MDSAAVLGHGRDGVARHEQRPPGRGLDRPLPHSEVDADCVGVEPRMAPGGVVIDAVDPAERVDRSFDKRCDRVLVTDVTAQAEGAPTGVHNGVRHGGRGLFGYIADRNRCALLSQEQRGGVADIRGSAAQEHDLSVELAHA